MRGAAQAAPLTHAVGWRTASRDSTPTGPIRIPTRRCHGWIPPGLRLGRHHYHVRPSGRTPPGSLHYFQSGGPPPFSGAINISHRSAVAKGVVLAGRPGGRGARWLESGGVGGRCATAAAATPGARRRLRGVASGARYWLQIGGTLVTAIWMKMSDCGIRGARASTMPAWRGEESPLRRLHGAQAATMFSQLESPPFERGTTCQR